MVSVKQWAEIELGLPFIDVKTITPYDTFIHEDHVLSRDSVWLGFNKVYKTVFLIVKTTEIRLISSGVITGVYHIGYAWVPSAGFDTTETILSQTNIKRIMDMYRLEELGSELCERETFVGYED